MNSVQTFPGSDLGYSYFGIGLHVQRQKFEQPTAASGSSPVLCLSNRRRRENLHRVHPGYVFFLPWASFLQVSRLLLLLFVSLPVLSFLLLVCAPLPPALFISPLCYPAISASSQLVYSLRQDPARNRPVLALRACLLALDYNTGRSMCQLDG